MAVIFYNYSFGHRCFCHFTWSGILGKSMHLKNDHKMISDLIQECQNIDKVIQILQANSTISKQLTSQFAHFYFEVTIDDKHFTLDSELRILTQEELKREQFEPRINYDIDDIREGTIKPLECRLLLECNSLEAQIKLIEDYLRRPRKRFKKWLTKPNALFLHHTYGENPKEFGICYD